MSKNQTAAKNGQWKGGRSVASNGYVLIRVGTDHPLADVRGYAYEHRLVASDKIGRLVLASEQIHHKDGNKLNNHPDNLEVMPSQAHHRVEHRTTGKDLRMPDEPNPQILCACGCGEAFPKYDESGRPRSFVSGHNSARPRSAQEIITCQCGCGVTFPRWSEAGYERQFAVGHSKRTLPKPQNEVVVCACGCGQELWKFDDAGRPRRFVSGHNARIPRK